MMHDYWTYGGGYDAWGFVFMPLTMILVILGVILAVRYLSRNGQKGESGESAMDVLKKRYANGEIDKKEFDEKKKDLKD